MEALVSRAAAALRSPRGSAAALYCLCLGCLGLCLSTLGPVLLDLSVQIEASLRFTSYSYLVRSIAYAVGSTVGPLYDRLAGHVVLSVALLAAGLGAALIPAARSLLGLMAAVCFQGFAMGAVDTGANVLLLYWFAGDTSGAMAPVMQALHFVFAIGATCGPLLLQAVAAAEGEDHRARVAGSGVYDPAFYIVCALCLSTGGALLTRRSPKPRTAGGDVTGSPAPGGGLAAADASVIRAEPLSGGSAGFSSPVTLASPADGGPASAGGAVGGGGAPLGDHAASFSAELSALHGSAPPVMLSSSYGAPSLAAPSQYPDALPIERDVSLRLPVGVHASAAGAAVGGAAVPGGLATADFDAPAQPPDPSDSGGAIVAARAASSPIAAAPAAEGGEVAEALESPAALRMRTWRVVALFAALLGLYVGAETGYGAFTTSYSVLELGTSEAEGQSLTSIYWAGIMVGRGAAIFIARKLSPERYLTMSMVGSAVTSAGLLVVSHNVPGLWVVSVCFGLCMASIFPTALTLAEEYFPVTGKDATAFVVGSAVGEMLLPAIIASLWGKDVSDIEGGAPSQAAAEDAERGGVGPQILLWVVAAGCLANLVLLALVRKEGRALRKALAAAAAAAAGKGRSGEAV